MGSFHAIQRGYFGEELEDEDGQPQDGHGQDRPDAPEPGEQPRERRRNELLAFFQ